MRYVCTTCGEGDMWTASAENKLPPLAARVPSESEGSDSTAWAPLPAHPHGESAISLSSTSSPQSAVPLLGPTPRSRTGSVSTTSSSLSIAVTNGSAGSNSGAPSPRLPDDIGFDEQQYTRRGYELCPACIETHGIVHAKAAAKGKSRDRSGKRARGFRHTFREKIWGNGKWVDVGE